MSCELLQSLHAPPFKTERPRTVQFEFVQDIPVNSPEVVPDAFDVTTGVVAGSVAGPVVAQNQVGDDVDWSSYGPAIAEWVASMEQSVAARTAFFRQMSNQKAIERLAPEAKEVCLKFVSVEFRERARLKLALSRFVVACQMVDVRSGGC